MNDRRIAIAVPAEDLRIWSFAGYEDVNDAVRLRHGPAMRWIVGGIASLFFASGQFGRRLPRCYSSGRRRPPETTGAVYLGWNALAIRGIPAKTFRLEETMIAAMLVLALAIPATTPSTADPVRVVAATTVADDKVKAKLVADYNQWRLDHDGIGILATARLKRIEAALSPSALAKLLDAAQSFYSQAAVPVRDANAPGGYATVITTLFPAATPGQAAVLTYAVIAAAQQQLKDQLDSMSEMTSIRLQMAMDRRAKFVEALSNILKTIDATSDTIVQNLK